jgi:hypothetical protein
MPALKSQTGTFLVLLSALSLSSAIIVDNSQKQGLVLSQVERKRYQCLDQTQDEGIRMAKAKILYGPQPEGVSGVCRQIGD